MPTLKEFLQKYGANFESNDKKAIHIFKMYESHEKVRRLQVELLSVKNGEVDEAVLASVVGLRRAARYQSFENWGRLMLIWLSEAKI